MGRAVGVSGVPSAVCCAAAHAYNADQIRFLRAVQEIFLRKKFLVEADLYEAPLTIFGDNAVERYFSPAEIAGLLKLTAHLAA